MQPHPHVQPHLLLGPPSQLLVQLAPKFSFEFPVLDAGCGTGRNAFALAQLGLTVICADQDQERLNQMIVAVPAGMVRGALIPACINLAPETWPFTPVSFSAVVCVHFLDVTLLPLMHSSLVARGYLYIETIGGQGKNYLELPFAGELRDLLAPHFRFELYQERPVGPAKSNKRAVKLFAQKIQ